MNPSRLSLSVYFITANAPDELEILRAALAGGVDVVQFRHKGPLTDAVKAEARALQDLCRGSGVPFLVNDHVELAASLEADGVHLGQSDGSVEAARARLGREAIIGVSAGSVEEAVAAERAGADYVGAGDVFGTPSKPDVDPPIGLAGLERLARSVSIPVVAIGGITVENAASAIHAGAAGVATISAIHGAEAPAAAARALREAVNLGLGARS